MSDISDRALVGAEPDTKAATRFESIKIGEGTVVRQFVTIQQGTTRQTTIGARCLLMHGAYIAHDCILGDDVTVCANAALAGHVQVMRGANLGMGCTIHQWVTIGAYAMVGMGAAVIDDVPPGWTVAGVPARIIGWNRVGLERAGIDEKTLADLRDEWVCKRTGKRQEVVAGVTPWP